MGFLENLFQTTLPGECTGKKSLPKSAPAAMPAREPAQPEPAPAQPTAAPQAAPAQPQNGKLPGEQLMEALMTPSNFPGYTLYQDVHPGVIDATAHPKSRHITYLLRLNGVPKMAIFLLDKSQERAMPTVGTCRILDSRRIPYRMFFRREAYDFETVLNSLRRDLKKF